MRNEEELLKELYLEQTSLKSRTKEEIIKDIEKETRTSCYVYVCLRMNDLEYVNVLISESKQAINKAKYLDDKIELIINQERLLLLENIKKKILAWEVVKKHTEPNLMCKEGHIIKEALELDEKED